MKKSEQMMMPSGLSAHFREAVDKTIEKPQKGDDDLLLSLGTSDGWALLMSIVEKTTEMIDAQTKVLVGGAKSWEEAGKYYFARDVAVDAVKAVTDVVQLRLAAKEAEGNAEPDKTEEE